MSYNEVAEQSAVYAQHIMALERAAYVLAMAVLQSDLYVEGDDELRNAVALATKVRALV